MKFASVFISGPYSGDVEENVRKALEAADSLMALGYVPYVPHLCHYWELKSHKSYEEWNCYFNKWLTICDYVLRLPGESSGADAEVKLANELGIRVVDSIDSLVIASACYPLGKEIET